MSAMPPICITVLAHNEEARIAACLNSLPLGVADVAIHVVVNGSTDRTADIARGIANRASNIIVHDWAEGGKARSWNRFLFGTLPDFHQVHVFVDGDAEIAPGSVTALAAALAAQPDANAASGLPLNGRKVAFYQEAIRRDHGLFGDLYALSGDFLRRMKAQGIRLPDDVVGDDGLVCAMAKTDLGSEANWNDARVTVCEGAGFLCAPVRLLRPASWAMQYKRMISYSIRHFQNGLITKIMRDTGPVGLPERLASLYAAGLATARPRPVLPTWWFDRLALVRMRAHAGL